jgi:hypothetical protein
MLLQRLKSQADSVGELIEPELVLAEVEELQEGASEVGGRGRAWPAGLQPVCCLYFVLCVVCFARCMAGCCDATASVVDTAEVPAVLYGCLL